MYPQRAGNRSTSSCRHSRNGCPDITIGEAMRERLTRIQSTQQLDNTVSIYLLQKKGVSTFHRRNVDRGKRRLDDNKAQNSTHSSTLEQGHQRRRVGS